MLWSVHSVIRTFAALYFLGNDGISKQFLLWFLTYYYAFDQRNHYLKLLYFKGLYLKKLKTKSNFNGHGHSSRLFSIDCWDNLQKLMITLFFKSTDFRTLWTSMGATSCLWRPTFPTFHTTFTTTPPCMTKIRLNKQTS